MGRVRMVATALLLVMVAAVVVGLVTAAEGAAGDLLTNVWGVVTIVDLYLALGVVWGWIAWRERSAGRAALWGVALVVTGSIAAWGYVAWAAARADSVPALLLGDRATEHVG